MPSGWDILRKAVLSTHNIENNETAAYKYSARAAYDYSAFGHMRQGMCVDIDPHDTVGCGLRSRCSQWTFVLSITMTVVAATILLFSPADTVTRKTFCVLISIIAVSIPLISILSSNRQLLCRIMCKSMLPWVKMYICSVETYCLCSLTSWSWRAFAVAPLLWSSQLTIFISDSIFYRRTQRWMILTLLMTFIVWRVVLLCGIKFHWFGELEYTTFELWEIRFNNSGTLVAKIISMILFMVGQVIFKLRHPANLYSLKTSYTVLKNSSWMKLDRAKRVEKKEARAEAVHATEIQLQVHPTPESINDNTDQ